MYYKIFNYQVRSTRALAVQLSLMGLISFCRSAFKHWRRGASLEVVLMQFDGIKMCLRQLLCEWRSRNDKSKTV